MLPICNMENTPQVAWTLGGESRVGDDAMECRTSVVVNELPTTVVWTVEHINGQNVEYDSRQKQNQ